MWACFGQYTLRCFSFTSLVLDKNIVPCERHFATPHFNQMTNVFAPLHVAGFTNKVMLQNGLFNQCENDIWLFVRVLICLLKF